MIKIPFIFWRIYKSNQAEMNIAETRGIKSVLTDLGKQFNRLSERLDNRDSVPNVKISIFYFSLYSVNSIRLNLIVLF